MLQAPTIAVPFAVWCVQPDIIAVFETYAVNICNLGVHCAEPVGQYTEMVTCCNPGFRMQGLKKQYLLWRKVVVLMHLLRNTQGTLFSSKFQLMSVQ